MSDLMKICLSFITESNTTTLLSLVELDRLESIVVDVGHQKTLDVVLFLLEYLDKLLRNGEDDDLKSATKLCIVLRSIITSSPALLQKKPTAAKLVGDLCERMKVVKKLESDYQLFIGEILAEIIVKIYFALTAYENDSIDVESVVSSIPKKTAYLPWRSLVSPNCNSNGKLARQVVKFIRLSSDHRCCDFDDLGIDCLPNFCLVAEFWRSFLSNYSLFQGMVDGETMEKVIDYIRQEWPKCAGAKFGLRSAIIDFLSTFGVDAEEFMLQCKLGDNNAMEIGDDNAVINDSESPEKAYVVNALRNYELKDNAKLKNVFLCELEDEPVVAVQKLQMTAFAFEAIQSMAHLNDPLKSFLKELVDTIFVILPQIIAKSSIIDLPSAANLLVVLLYLCSIIIADKKANLAKHPIFSVGVACASIVSWDRYSADQKGGFFKAFVSFLKFLHVCQKKCNSLMISTAPNWMGVLRRLQLALINVMDAGSIESNDDASPLFYRLGRFYSNLDQCKELEKIAAFMLFDLVDLMKRLQMSDVQRESLLRGVYRLIRICDSYSISMVTAMMDDASKEIFRVMYDDYVKYYKYSGQV